MIILVYYLYGAVLLEKRFVFCKLQHNLPPAVRTVVTCLWSRLNEFALISEVEVDL